jgi:hypothetical protein
MKSPVKMKVAFSFVLFLACAWGCSALAEESAKYMEPAPSEEAKALDYILSKVDGEILADDPENQKLFGCCNFNSWCPADNIKGIGSLGFRPSTEDLLVSLANTTQCSTPKFDATFALNPPLDTKIGGGNILHQIVAKSAQGRPVLDRACLVHAIDQISKKAPQLLSEKNIDARTPLEAALYLKTHPKQWGSSIQAKDFNPLIEELQQTLSTAKK